jgi:3-oxoacyl-(acyl-carrier-protein) synthase III
METFVAQIPVPSMGATVHELTLIDVEVEAGESVKKGQKCAEFESDKSAFDFEAPCSGTITKILVRAGDIVDANAPFFWIETDDNSQKHLEVSAEAANGVDDPAPKVVVTKPGPVAAPASPTSSVSRPSLRSSRPSGSVKWTPKALRIVRDAGFDPETITDIPPTGPGGRVSGDDVQAYLATQPTPTPAAKLEPEGASDRETVCIAGIGFAVPETVITNKELLENFPGKNEEEIFKTTGISQRHIAAEGEGVTTYAAQACEKALAMAGIDVSVIDGIIMATIIPDQPVPSSASALAKHLGIPGALAFDLNAACSGWLYALETGRAFIRSGTAKNLLVVTGELLSRITNYEDYSTAFLFGDGAGAAVLTDSESGHQLHQLRLSGDASQYEAIQRTGGGAKNPIAKPGCDLSDFYITMNGAAVFKYAVVAFADIIEATLKRENLTVDDVAWVVPHQANERILKAVSKRVGVPYERFVVTIGKYANTSAASVSMALGWAAEEGIFEPGDKIIFCSVGAGLTYAGGLLEW